MSSFQSGFFAELEHSGFTPDIVLTAGMPDFMDFINDNYGRGSMGEGMEDPQVPSAATPPRAHPTAAAMQHGTPNGIPAGPQGGMEVGTSNMRYPPPQQFPSGQVPAANPPLLSHPARTGPQYHFTPWVPAAGPQGFQQLGQFMLPDTPYPGHTGRSPQIMSHNPSPLRGYQQGQTAGGHMASHTSFQQPRGMQLQDPGMGGFNAHLPGQYQGQRFNGCMGAPPAGQPRRSMQPQDQGMYQPAPHLPSSQPFQIVGDGLGGPLPPYPSKSPAVPICRQQPIGRRRQFISGQRQNVPSVDLTGDDEPFLHAGRKRTFAQSDAAAGAPMGGRMAPPPPPGSFQQTPDQMAPPPPPTPVQPTPTSADTPIKRGRGRPKGSKNKTQAEKDEIKARKNGTAPAPAAPASAPQPAATEAAAPAPAAANPPVVIKFTAPTPAPSVPIVNGHQDWSEEFRTKVGMGPFWDNYFGRGFVNRQLQAPRAPLTKEEHDAILAETDKLTRDRSIAGKEAQASKVKKRMAEGKRGVGPAKEQEQPKGGALYELAMKQKQSKKGSGPVKKQPKKNVAAEGSVTQGRGNRGFYRQQLVSEAPVAAPPVADEEDENGANIAALLEAEMGAGADIDDSPVPAPTEAAPAVLSETAAAPAPAGADADWSMVDFDAGMDTSDEVPAVVTPVPAPAPIQLSPNLALPRGGATPVRSSGLALPRSPGLALQRMGAASSTTAPAAASPALPSPQEPARLSTQEAPPSPLGPEDALFGEDSSVPSPMPAGLGPDDDLFGEDSTALPSTEEAMPAGLGPDDDLFGEIHSSSPAPTPALESDTDTGSSSTEASTPESARRQNSAPAHEDDGELILENPDDLDAPTSEAQRVGAAWRAKQNEVEADPFQELSRAAQRVRARMGDEAEAQRLERWERERPERERMAAHRERMWERVRARRAEKEAREEAERKAAEEEEESEEESGEESEEE